MKSVTALLKLVFAAMLVCLVLGVQPARAYQVGNYNCNSGYETCYAQNQSSMSSCATDCTDHGGQEYEEMCYGDEEIVAWSDGSYIVDSETICGDVNEDANQCMEACINNYESGVAECLESYCTYAG